MGKDPTSDSPPNMQIATAHPDSEKLRRDIFSAYSQIAELQARCEAQSKELDSVEDELDAKKCLVMDKGYEITTLTNKVNQLEYEFATWAEKCAAEHRDNEKLQRDLAAFSSHIADLEQRYAAQAIHNELQIETSQLEHTITFLTTAFTHAQSEERAEAEQFATARRDLEHLRRLLSTQTIIVGEHGGDELSIEHSCTGALEQRMQAFRLISSLSRVPRSTQFCRLALDLREADSELLEAELLAAELQIEELQMSYDAQSKKLGSFRNELQITRLLVEEKDRTITTLAAKVDQLERAVATKKKQFAAEGKDKVQLLFNLSAFLRRIANLQWRYDAQSRAIHEQLQTEISLLKHTITFLTTTFMQAQSEDKVKAEQIATARRDLEQLRCVLSKQMTSLRERYVVQSQELKSVRDELHSTALEAAARYNTTHSGTFSFTWRMGDSPPPVITTTDESIPH